MQFVRNGPDVPERLLQAHEEGRVVLFCGAGVSRPAGLPDFAGLVRDLYANLADQRTAEERMAIKAKRFDTAIGLLETRIVGGREKVRSELANILTPALGGPGRTDTHEALLTLSRTREGRTRIVTTNFDRLFKEAICRDNIDVEAFQAPLLPVPKSRWDGIVYLHGRLSEKPSAQELDRLVVSSGDFGLAYLNERWAARFVSELFRNYTVCFVGYSLDDPVLRYMMDALAADRLLGESPLDMFAFGSYSKGKEADRAAEWKAKNVIPILYREHKNHWYLHKTLRQWARTYHDGVDGKELIVTQLASTRPVESTGKDDFVGRVLWALSDPSGLPAKRFADHDPAPSLDWLKPLCDTRYRHRDLNRFGVPPLAKEDNELEFSLIHRPSPYTLAPWITLVDRGVVSVGWDTVTSQLARWLLRHLDNPELLLWLARGGGRLHHKFAGMVEWRLEELHKIENNNDTEKLRCIRNNAPRAIPRPAVRVLWRLLLAGRMKSPLLTSGLHDWKRRFRRHGRLTAALRLELRELLTPRIALDEPRLPNGEGPKDPERIEDIVHSSVVLSSQNVLSELSNLRKNPSWHDALPCLLDDFHALLRDAMDLLRELGKADDRSDYSYIRKPSIEEHPQNRDSSDWTALIELTRDAWRATAKVSPERARLTAEAWHLTTYPVFRRLAFFAAAHDNIVSPRKALDWLLIDEGWWLWSSETQREATRLLVALTRSLDAERLNDLEQTVLVGPPRTMYRDDLETEDWIHVVEWEIWQRVAKMNEADTPMGGDAKRKFDELIERHPDWQLRDEFPTWAEDVNIPRAFVAAPRRRRDLVKWLKQYPKDDVWQDDDWPRRCQDDFPTTACALCSLAGDGAWPADRWIQALHAWSEENLIKRSWRYMAPVLANAPNDVLQLLSRGIGRWLRNIGKTDPDETLFLDLCRRILALEYQDGANESVDDPVTRAINHPVGYVTEALLRWWSRNTLKDGDGLPNKLDPIFTDLCNTRVGKFRHGRVLMAAHVITLFRVDHEWAASRLLPLFDWQRDEAEARAAWKGFLWSPRLYRPLMESIKQSFLDTASHYEALDQDGGQQDGGQYASLLTFAALDPGDTFTVGELATATAALPEEGLQCSAHALARALDSSGDRRTEYWRNRVRPYLRSIWPKSRDRRIPAISELLARVCIVVENEFPDAVKELRHWLQPPQYPDHLIRRLKKAELCRKFPKDALDFLHLVVSGDLMWGDDLKACLEDIRTASPELADDPRFRKLRDRLRQSGHELK